MALDFEPMPHQVDFVADCETDEIAFVGGRGTGKTTSLLMKALTLALMNAGYIGVLLAPSFSIAEKAIQRPLRTLLDKLQSEGRLTYKENKTNHVHEIKFAGTNVITPIYVLSAENLRDSLGMNIAWFGIDECDTINPGLAEEIWLKLKMARRVGNVRQAFAGSTPEGFGFMYRHFKNCKPEDKQFIRLIQAKTRDNWELPPGFVEEIRRSSPAHMIEAYLNGEFVNMANGTVYSDYDTELNRSSWTAEKAWEVFPNAPLHIGMDFNVKHPTTHPHGIAAVVGMILDFKPHIVDEIYGYSRTVDVIKAIKDKYPGRTIIVYPDATAKGDRTSATVSDRAQLQAAGFIDRSPMGNPAIEDRVNAVSSMLCNGKGERKLFINPNTCPILSQCLSQQPYDDKGKPEKDTGYDDPNDALGYFINVNWPVKRAHVNQSGITY